MTQLVVVDDHEALREGLSAMLSARGLEIVGPAGNAAAGLDLVTVADPHVALIDIGLPDGDGIALTRELLRLRPELGWCSTRETRTPTSSPRGSTPGPAGTR